MSVHPMAQPPISGEQLEQAAWRNEQRSAEVCRQHLERLGEDRNTALPVDGAALADLWRGVRAEQAR